MSSKQHLLHVKKLDITHTHTYIISGGLPTAYELRRPLFFLIST